MKTRRIVLVLLAATMALAAVGVASAQPQTQQRGDREGRRPHPVANTARHIVATVAEATGLEQADIAAQLAEGKTLAEVITENGGSTDEVKATLLADAGERLATAVENGRITQERADEMLANADTQIDTLLNNVFERLEGRERPAGVGNIIDTVAEATGLERADIAAQLAEGKTLAELITENGGSTDDVKATLLAAASERIATAVENGRITQERADEMLANADTRIDTLLNNVFERLEGREFPGGRRNTQTENEI